MASATHSWKGGSLVPHEGRWGIASDWSDGSAPAPGDTDIIAGIKNTQIQRIGETYTFPALLPAYTFVELFPKQAAEAPPSKLHGYDIIGQTLVLAGHGDTGIPDLWLQQTTLSNDTIQVTGTVVLDSYLNNSIGGGRLEVGGRGHGAGTLQFQLYGVSDSGDAPGTVPATTLASQTTIAHGSTLNVIAVTSAGEPPDNFGVNGTITIQAGGTFFVDDTDGSGIMTGADNNTDVINQGLIEVNGAAGATTSASITANTIGSGTIEVSGHGAARAATTLTLSGNVTNQTIIVDDGTISVNDAQLVIGDPSEKGFVVSGGSFTFGPDGGTLLLHQPQLTSLVFIDHDTRLVQNPNGQHPFTTPIFGFGSGDTIGLVKAAQGESFYTAWDASKHLLSVDFGSDAQYPGIQAQFTLEGSYRASGFHLSTDAQTELLSLTYRGPHT